MNKFIDIGANLANHQFTEDLEEVITNSQKADLDKIILTTTDENTFLFNLELIKKYPHFLHTTYGIHPHNAKHHKSFIENTYQLFLKHIQNDTSIISIGEIGLDFFRNISSPKEQIDCFSKFLALSQNFTHLPLFLHERDAFHEFVEIYESIHPKNNGVLHCFTGGKERLNKYLDLGLYIGITGLINNKNKNSDIIDLLSYIPLDRILFETDAPYLMPRNIQNKMTKNRNEPQYLPKIIKHFSDIINQPFEKVSEISYNNTINLFNLDSPCLTKNQKFT